MKLNGKEVATAKDKKAILDQVVKDTVADQQKRVLDLSEQVAKTETQSVVQPIVLDEDSKKIIEYLEKEILPHTKNQSFSGMVPLMKDGKMDFKKVSSSSELEQIIKDLKSGSVKMGASVMPEVHGATTATVRDYNKREEKEEKKVGIFTKVKNFFN